MVDDDDFVWYWFVSSQNAGISYIQIVQQLVRILERSMQTKQEIAFSSGVLSAWISHQQDRSNQSVPTNAGVIAKGYRPGSFWFVWNLGIPKFND